jgi:hypothetical protein
MTAQRSQIALTGLQWTLGLVILIEAILFVMPGAAHGFAQTHMPNVVRLVLGFGEIARLRPHADPANCHPWRLGSGSRFRPGDRHSPSARDVRRRKSGDLHRRSLGGRRRQNG